MVASHSGFDFTGVSCINGECVVHVGLPFLECITGHLHLFGIADLALANVDFERRVGDVLAHLLDRDHVFADLSGRERNTNISGGQPFQEARLLQAARRLNSSVQRAYVRVGYFPGKRDLAAGADRDLVALPSLSGNFGDEGRPFDMFVAETHRNFVLPWRSR